VVYSKYISPFDSSGPPEVFYAYFYNHAYRFRLEKLLSSFLEVPTDILNHFWIHVVVSILKPPQGVFRIETAVT
jgi:hypothetical protein